jgi:hypothetical protein
MLTAQRVKNFTPQNDSLTAPRRVEVTQPKMEQAAPQTPYSFPAVRDIDGGVKFEENKFNHVRNAGKLNPFEAMYPCIISPALRTNVHISQPPVEDTYGYVAPYGNARGSPTSIRGIASIPRRDALLSQPVRPVMAINSVLAPMMKNQMA